MLKTCQLDAGLIRGESFDDRYILPTYPPVGRVGGGVTPVLTAGLYLTPIERCPYRLRSW